MRSSNLGFTLLEVMIALVIMGMLVIILFSATTSTVDAIERSRIKTFSTWIAENKMAELRLAKELPAAREYKQDLDFAQREWELVSKVKKTENPDINRVELEVYLKPGEGRDKEKTHAFTGFVGRY